MASEPASLLNEATQSSVDQTSVYDDGYLRIEHDNYYIKCAGKRISLPRKEFLIFSRLARNVERVVTAEEIWRSAWRDDIPFNSLTLRVHIHRLRRTFHPFGIHIDSMIGVGYSLTLEQPGCQESGDDTRMRT